MDREYWIEYYNNQSTSEQPSDFAKFVADKYTPEFGKLIDIGCGNGRDTLYFASQNIPTFGIDQCPEAIAANEKKNLELGLSTSFRAGDFSDVDYDDLAQGPYSLYSRFTLHAINYQEEERLFNHIDNGKQLSHLLIEARTIRDGIYGDGKEVGPHEYVTSHYRRFIDPDKLKSRLEKNFEIHYFEESRGFAKTETEDPCLVRVLARRK